jgi:hypothetical protein
MTSNDLIPLIEDGPTSQLLAVLALLSEAQRARLSRAAIACHKKFAKQADERNCSEALEDSFYRAHLALFAVGPYAAVQNVRVWRVFFRWNRRQHGDDALFQVLDARRPDWLPRWVDRELAAEMANWQFVRRLIRAGLCPRPASDDYILKMRPDGAVSMIDWLRADTELLDYEIWRIFEIMPGRRTVMWGSCDIRHMDTQSHFAGSTWAGCLRTLSREGKLDRSRLLTASLEAVQRHTQKNNTAWFSTFHEFLQPTLEERAARQPSYLHLLGHPVSSVVSMALSALLLLEQAQRLDVTAYLKSIGAVFRQLPKAPPFAALKALGRLSQAKEYRPQIAETALVGLTHVLPQVQEGSLALLEKIKDDSADVLVDRLPQYLDQLAPSVQESARRLFRSIRPETDPAPQPQTVGDQIVADARAVPSAWREAAGIDRLLQAFFERGQLQAIRFDPMSVPRLYQDGRVAEIASRDELIQRLTVSVEALNDPLEFELLVDGLSRFCGDTTGDFSAQTAPLLHRVTQLMAKDKIARGISAEAFEWDVESRGLRAPLFQLILAWCTGETREPIPVRMKVRIFHYLRTRMEALESRIRNRQAAPLLACPTHRGGWIDPASMHRRLQWHQQHGVEPMQHDFLQGVLRLAPDGRAKVLKEAASLCGTYAPAFRFALGGPIEDADLPTAVWVAAGRARSPFAAVIDHHACDVAGGPDAFQSARYSWNALKERHPFLARIELSVEPPVQPSGEELESPSRMIHDWELCPEVSWIPLGANGLNRWVALVWPTNLDPFLSAGARIRTPQYNPSALFRQMTSLLEPLFDPDVPFTELARIVVASALSKEEPEVTGLAVDILIEMIRDGRCSGRELGEVMHRMAGTGLFRPNRLAKHFDTVSRVSLLHTHVCAQIVQTACASTTQDRKDLHHLLGPLVEWLTATGEEVNPEFRRVLTEITSGKARALAGKLLALKMCGDRHAILLDALAGRLERVKRWQNRGTR